MNKDMLGGDAENLFSAREWYELGRIDATYDAYDNGKADGEAEGFNRGWRAGYDDAMRDVAFNSNRNTIA